MFIHTFTLCCRVSSDTWWRLKEIMYDDLDFKKYNKYRIYRDQTQLKGVHIINEKYKEKSVILGLHRYSIGFSEESCDYFNNCSLTLRVNPYILTKDKSYIGLFELTDDHITLLADKINQCLTFLGVHVDDSSTMFGSRQFLLKDFRFQRIDLSMNLQLPNCYMTQLILGLIRKCRVPQGYERRKYYDSKTGKYKSYDYYEKIHCGSLAISAYHKSAQMDTQEKIHYSIYDIEHCEDIIRIEAQLKSSKVQGLANKWALSEPSPENVLRMLKEDTCYFDFLDTVFLKGNYRTYHETIHLINSSTYHKKTKEKMLELVEWTNKRNGTLEAALLKSQKKHGYSGKELLDLLSRFEMLNINPVTIPPAIKNYDYIPCISKLLRSDVII